MNNVGISDLWDIIIDRYCNKNEKKILSEIDLDAYGLLKRDYKNLIDNIQRVINSNS